MIYRLFIGADNKTKRIRKAAARKVLNNYFAGYTVTDAIGAWRGAQEASMIVEIATPRATPTKIQRMCRELARTLNQEAIGVVAVNESMYFVK